MKSETLSLIAVLALSVPESALAHGKDGVHLKGTVQAVNEDRLTVETTEKKREVVRLDEKTKYDRAGVSVAATDLVVGERVVVHARKAKNGALDAELVKVGKRPGDTASPPPAKKDEHRH